MYVPFHGDGIISQFEGYEDLRELDWDGYRETHGNIQRLDRILRAEGDHPDRYKLAKQADTALLFFLFTPEEIAGLLGRLGYDWDPDSARRNIDYYDQRTSHGSTLSYIAHAGMLAPIEPEHSWERFLVALESDVGDIQGGTTKEGIHLGVMAGNSGSDPARLYGRSGPRRRAVLLADADRPTRRPVLSDAGPRHADPRGASADRELTVVITGGYSRPIKVGIGDDVRELGPGERCTFSARRSRPARPQDRRRRSQMMAAEGFRGAIFDVDGVLVDSPHEVAWRDTFNALMEHEWAGIRDQTSWTPEAFTSEVYQQVLSGKPRMDGARAALEHFGVPDPDGTRAGEYAERKQDEGRRADRGREVLGLSGRAALPAGGQGRRDQRRSGVVVEERRALPASDSPRYVRSGERPPLRLDRARTDPPGGLRRRHVRAAFRARQATSGHLPRGRRRARRGAAEGVRDRGRRLRHPGGEGRSVRGGRCRPPRRRGRSGRGSRRHRRRHARRGRRRRALQRSGRASVALARLPPCRRLTPVAAGPPARLQGPDFARVSV